MNKFKILLNELLSIDKYKVKFAIDYKNGLLLTETGIDNSYTVSIKKNYKGYSCEIVEWTSPSFGKQSNLKSTKQKDIIDFLKLKINKRISFGFSD